MAVIVASLPLSAAKFTSTVTVKSDNPDAGEVCVTHATTSYLFVSYTHKQPADPADSDYAAEVSTGYTSSGGNTAGEQRYYIYAKAKPGYKFVRWEGGTSGAPVNTTEANYTYTWKHYTKGETLPGITSTITAYFVADNAVATETNIPAGVVTLSPEAPQVGDEVTATSTMRRIVQGGTPGNKNMMTAFSHWEDGDGNILSTDETFTFTVERPMTLKAIYNNLGEVPQKGKYYRIRNAWNRVLTIEGGYKFSISGATDVSHSLLRWALPTDHDYSEFHTGTTNDEWTVSDAFEPLCPEASPSTIFYIADAVSGDTSATKCILASQGADTKTLTSQTLDFVPMSDNFCGYYGIRASSLTGAGFKTVIRDKDAYVNISSFGDTDVYAALAVQPIDEEHIDLFWFGAAPDATMRFENGYWTSMYTAFPYECRDGVEAYYVKETVTSAGNSYAVLTRVENDRVPANTGVLLKCSSVDTKENRLLPLDPSIYDIPALEGNMLKGVFQLYTSSDKSGRVTFDADNMRVFGINSTGNVGFFRLASADPSILPPLAANRAYLDISRMQGAKSLSFRIASNKDGISSIEEIETDNTLLKAENIAIYNLAGQRVIHPVAGQIYIVNGKKVIWQQEQMQ